MILNFLYLRSDSGQRVPYDEGSELFRKHKAGYTAADASDFVISLIPAARLFARVCVCVSVYVWLSLVFAAPLTR